MYFKFLKGRIIIPLIYLLIGLFCTEKIYAEIVTDGSVGPGMKLSGPNFIINEKLGTIKGNNLFHSFTRFNIDQQQSATFLGSSHIKNVINRVTGGEFSTINGLLKSQVGQADFYFINPAGVVFGANAQIDVPASFYVSTADSLVFKDGTEFSASNPSQSTLTVSEPDSFGFSGTHSTNIVFDGNSITLKQGNNLSVTAGNIEIDNSKLEITSGAIQLSSVGDKDVQIRTNELSEEMINGSVVITNSSMNVSGNSGGKIILQGGDVVSSDSELLNYNSGTIKAPEGTEISVKNLALDNTHIVNNVTGSGESGKVIVKVNNQLDISNGGVIASSSFATGDASLIFVEADGVKISAGQLAQTGIISYTQSEGDAGQVRLDVAGALEIYEGGQVGSNTLASGDAGLVQIKANRISIDSVDYSGLTGISSQSSASTGQAGVINIHATDGIDLSNGGVITSSTFSSGNAGKIEINAGQINIDRQGALFLTGIYSISDSIQDNAGLAGGVTIISPGSLNVINGGEISSSTFSSGDAGTVNIQGGQLLIDGQGSATFTGISSQAAFGSGGDAGEINVAVADLLEIYNGGEISSNTFSSGHAGTVIVETGRAEIDGQGKFGLTGIASQAAFGSGGDAGQVNVAVANALKIYNGGEISSNTFSSGSAGTVIVQAGDVEIDGQGNFALTGIASQATSGSTGNAGEVYVTISELLHIMNGGAISSDTFASGNAGSIFVKAGDIKIDRMSSSSYTGILSNAYAFSSGHAGKLDIVAQDSVEIVNGGSISSNAFSSGNAGTVDIQASQIMMDGKNSEYFTGISSNTESDLSGAGDAGELDIKVQGLLEIYNGSEIGSNTFSDGNAGTINIEAGQLLVNNQANAGLTGITSQATSGSTGHAGEIIVTISELLQLINGGSISSDTFSSGNAGTIKIQTGDLLINDLGYSGFTGIASRTLSDLSAAGDAGELNISVQGLMEVYNGGSISSSTFSDGNAGSVSVQSGELTIDGQDYAGFTGISSSTLSDATGAGSAGELHITVAGLLGIYSGGEIASNTFSEGNAGKITVQAGKLTIDDQGYDGFTGISSQATSDSSGNAGEVFVNISELLSIVSGGSISSETFSSGNAGTITIMAGQLLLNGQGYSGFTGIASRTLSDSSGAGDAGELHISVQGLMELYNGGNISSSTFSDGNAGKVIVETGQIIIDGKEYDGFTGISSQANSDSSGDAGEVFVVTADLLQIVNGGAISSDTFSSGNAGSIFVNAGEIEIDRKSSSGYTGILTNAYENSSGNAGQLNIIVQDSLTIENGGSISSNTVSSGNAGRVDIQTSYLRVDGQDSEYFTGISSNTESDLSGAGDAGELEIAVYESIEIYNGGEVVSNTFSQGNAGKVTVQTGKLTVNGQNYSGFTGIASSTQSESMGAGDAGELNISVKGLLELYNGGEIGTSTFSDGHAGTINIQAGELTINGSGYDGFSGISSQAAQDSSGNAGEISVTITDLLQIINGGSISSDTFSSGNAGSIIVHANDIVLNGDDGTLFTGIGSDAVNGSSGDAGKISVWVENLLKIINGSEISSSSDAIGNAGEIAVNVNQLYISGKDSEFRTGIFSQAEANSTGEVGDVSINANNIGLYDGGQISIASYSDRLNTANDSAHKLSINSYFLAMDGESFINAESVGNIPAADISLTVTDETHIHGLSAITTEADDADGGSISFTSGLVHLKNSQITTSVFGQQGDGGDILVVTPLLVMDNGFIQANTSAIGASGGDIFVDAGQFIMPGNQELVIGGNKRLVFEPYGKKNVIQAAAPDGISGSITITSPELDLSASITSINAKYSKLTPLINNPCEVLSGSVPSSLISSGQGGIPHNMSDSISIPLGRRLTTDTIKNSNKINSSTLKSEYLSINNTLLNTRQVDCVWY